MSEPKRLRVSSDAPPAVRAMLQAARKPRPMTDDERARTAAKIAGLAATPIAAAAVGKFLTGKTLALLAAFAGLGAVVAIAFAYRGPSRVVDSSAPTLVAASSAPRLAPPAIDVSAPPAPSASASALVVAPPSATTTVASTAASASASSSSSTFDAETAITSKAMEAFATGRPAETLTLCADHHAQFPNGALTMECDALEVRALHKLGRDAEATEKAERFVSKYPGSPYGTQLLALTKGN